MAQLSPGNIPSYSAVHGQRQRRGMLQLRSEIPNLSMALLLLAMVPAALCTTPTPASTRITTCNQTTMSVALAKMFQMVDASNTTDWQALAASERAQCSDDGSLLRLDLSRLGLIGMLPEVCPSVTIRELDLSMNHLTGLCQAVGASAASCKPCT